jgi:hypothetical protein
VWYRPGMYHLKTRPKALRWQMHSGGQPQRRPDGLCMRSSRATPKFYGRRLGVTELALITLGAIERQLRRLVISPVGGKAILLVRPPHATTFDTTVNDGKTLGLHDLSLRHPELTWCTRVIYSAGEEFP